MIRDSTETRNEESGTVRSYRRRFLQGVGAAGTAGVLAGCLGGDENGDENGGENGDENGDEPEPEPAFFEVNSLYPGDTTETRGSTVEISAEITNTGDEDATQDVELVFDGESEGSESLELTGGQTDSILFGEYDTTEFTIGDYEYDVSTDDDSASATLTVEGAIGDDPDELVSLDSSDVARGTQTITATIDNPYGVALEDGEVTLEGPDGWEITAQDGTSFDSLEAVGSQTAEWELTVPDDAEGDHELTATVSYASGDETAEDVTATFTVSVDLWMGIEYEEVAIAPDYYEDLEEDQDAPGDIGGDQHDVELDLSEHAGSAVQIRFEDYWPSDGWGSALYGMSVSADGEEIHSVSPPDDDEYLVEDSGSNGEAFDDHRFADNDSYWVYQFDVPGDADSITTTLELANGFHVFLRSRTADEDDGDN